MVNYFTNLNFPFPQFCNPADYLIEFMTFDGIMIEFLTQGKEIRSENIQKEYDNRI